MLVFFSVFLFPAGTSRWEQLPPALQLLEHHSVWFEDLFEVSNNFDASIHRRVRVMYLYSSGDETNMRNRELRKARDEYTEIESIVEISDTYYCALFHATNKK